MARPSKPVKVIEMDGKSHITKKEIRHREAAEESLLTGTRLQESAEVKADKRAHKEFLKVKKIFAAIDKDDDIYGNEVNRYCLLSVECMDLTESRVGIANRMKALDKMADDMLLKDYLHDRNELMRQLEKIDRRLEEKRKAMFTFEKENCMTIASALRSIPKKPEKKKNALQEALSG